MDRHKVADQDGVNSDEEAEIADRRRRAQLRTAVIWFQPSISLNSLDMPKDTQLGIYRALFPPLENAIEYLVQLKSMQLRAQKVGEEGERRITLLMVAGGHFAGMVVRLRPKGKSERVEVKGAGEVMVLKHKTFHRYTSEWQPGSRLARSQVALSITKLPWRPLR